MKLGMPTVFKKCIPLLRRLIFLFSIIFASFFVLYNSSCLAASALDVLDRERDRVRDEPRSLVPLKIEEDRKPSQGDANVQFTLASLHIFGCTVFSEEELLAPYAKLSGTKISFASLNSIVAELTQKYRDAGYLLSRAILPAQEVNLFGANVRLAVVEGYIADIQYTGDKRVLDRFKSWFAPVQKKLLSKKPLRHKDFEREMLLLQDLPGIRVSSRFQEASVPGGSLLILDVQGDLTNINLSWNNAGTESAGPGISSIGLGINTLPLIGAHTTITHSQADNWQEYYSLQAIQTYQFINGLSLRASYAYSYSPKPDSDFARLFDYNTQSHTASVGVSYPAIRTRDMNLSIGAGYEHRNSDAYVLDEPFTKDRLRTLSANLNFDFSDSLGGVTQIIPTIFKGISAWNATDKSLDSTNTLAPAEFLKADIYLSRNQQLSNNFSIFISSESQFSNTSLSSYNKFSFGGGQFGRGYDPGIIEGDNAIAFSVEPRWTHYLSDKIALQPFAFIDWGSLWTNESVKGMPDEEHASSWGGGMRLWGHAGKTELPDFNICAYVGQPIQRSGAYREDEMEPRFVFQATLYF